MEQSTGKIIKLCTVEIIDNNIICDSAPKFALESDFLNTVHYSLWTVAMPTGYFRCFARNYINKCSGAHETPPTRVDIPIVVLKYYSLVICLFFSYFVSS